MKVCFICTFFPPTTGGSEIHAFSLVKYLADKGHDVSVIISRSRREDLRARGYDEEVINNAFKERIVLPKIEEVPVYNIASHGLTSLIDIRKRIGEIENTGPIDVFDVHNSFLLPSLLFKKHPTVLSLDFYDFNCPHLGWPQKYMPDHFTLDPTNIFFSYNKCVLQKRCVTTLDYIRWRLIRSYALNKVNRIIVLNNYLKKLIVKTGVEEEKISVTPLWIDVDKINKQYIEKIDRSDIPQILDSDFVFTFLGRMVPPKGPLLLLKAFESVAKKAKNVKLLYIGGGPLARNLGQIAQDMGIRDRIVLMGRIPHENTIRFLSISDAFVHIGRYTNYGWSLLETMATGKPIIATNVGETSDILKDGYNALLTEPKPDSIASKMFELFSNKKLAKEIGANAYKTVKEKHNYKNIEIYAAILKECINK